MQTLDLNIGAHMEQLAADYLLQQNIHIILRNFTCRLGEIDIIGIDNISKTVIFFEVRYRRQSTADEAIESISYAKRKKLIKSALYFQKCHTWCQQYYQRFDLIAMFGSQQNPQITWLRNVMNYF